MALAASKNSRSVSKGSVDAVQSERSDGKRRGPPLGTQAYARAARPMPDHFVVECSPACSPTVARNDVDLALAPGATVAEHCRFDDRRAGRELLLNVQNELLERRRTLRHGAQGSSDHRFGANRSCASGMLAGIRKPGYRASRCKGSRKSVERRAGRGAHAGSPPARPSSSARRAPRPF